jgi:phosphoribosyl 1,2-cyclic phosphodiesterase
MEIIVLGTGANGGTPEITCTDCDACISALKVPQSKNSWF